MNKIRVFFALCTCLALVAAGAMANGLNLNSLGSKALSMGGAFVGLADDFSTIYWNPAGIARFKTKSLGFYGTDIIPSGKYSFEQAFVNAKTQNKHYLAGMIAYYVPLAENLVAGLGVYSPSGLGALWDGEDFATLSFLTTYEWESRIGMVTISPALGFQVSEQVYVGAAFNINHAVFNIKTHAGDNTLGVDLGQYDENLSGWGYGATLGILVTPSEKLSFGATVRTKTKISFSGDISIDKLNVLGMIPGTPLFGATIPTTTAADREVNWPWWIAGGVAVKPVPELTLTADLQWTGWSEIEVMESTYEEPLWNLLVDTERVMYWRDTLQIRFGAEYMINKVALRAGYYWDPAPAPDRTMNVLLPNYDFNVITAGLGYNLDGLQIDVALEFLMGKKRTVPFAKVSPLSPSFDPDWETAMPGDYEMKIFAPNLSIGYRF